MVLFHYILLAQLSDYPSLAIISIISLISIVLGLSKFWKTKRTEPNGAENTIHEDSAQLKAEIKLLQAKLEEANGFVENCKRSKEDFLSVMSHEIRTPLTAISGMTHLMNAAKSLEEARMHGRTMEKSVASLISLIEDVLDYNQIQAGNLELTNAEFDLHSALNDLIKNYRKSGTQKGIEVKLFLDPFLPMFIKADEERLLQVLKNLLDNSIKFTDSGRITLSAEYIRNVGDFQSDIKFSVTDTGIGIDENELVKVFDKINNGYLTTDRNYGGKGLGLSISKHLVHNMGGELEVSSEKGKGSKFFFTINVEKAQGKDSEHIVSTEDDELPEDLSILVVDDNEMNRIMLSQFLLKWKIQCEVAEDGADALKKVMRKHYDMILLDLQMPHMDGYEFTKEIRNTPEIADIPIIGISADSISNVHDGVTSAGMNDFITKPFDPKDLKEKINKFSKNLQRL